MEVRGLRRLTVGRYTIFYRPTPFEIRISRVLHQSRDYTQAFRKRKKSA